MKKQIYAAVTGILLLGAVTAGGWIYYDRMIRQSELDPVNEFQKYEKHYVLITEDMKSSFWQAVYSSAKEEAAKNGIYLELAGADLSVDYGIEDLMEVGIAAKADGIIVHPDGSKKIETLINKASSEAIPVVTVLDDAPQTKRRSFIGINSVQMGEEYGQEIIRNIEDDTKKVLVLLKGETENGNENLVFAQMKTTVKDALGKESKIEIASYQVKNQTAFDSEETIRSIFRDEDILPDILVCLDEVDTECAYQAVIDYNKVGEVAIIGYHPSEKILNAIKRNVVPATFEIDTIQMGIKCIDALLEYDKMGYVSDFNSVDLYLINQNNVQEYLESEEEQTNH